MGILVPEANLPNGFTLSNVYISFFEEVIYTSKNPMASNYNINAQYKVYKDETKQPNTNIRFPISIQVDDISIGVYTSLYENLKQLYPNSIDV